LSYSVNSQTDKRTNRDEYIAPTKRGGGKIGKCEAPTDEGL